MKTKHTQFIKTQNLVITELSGLLSQTDISEWSQSLQSTLETLPEGTRFKILVNLHGFKAENFEAHKQFRVVVPQTLAAFGWYVGYLRMFPEAEINITSKRSVYCVAAAHVHDDETKIKNYSDNYSMKNEAFFTDPNEARNWIESITI